MLRLRSASKCQAADCVIIENMEQRCIADHYSQATREFDVETLAIALYLAGGLIAAPVFCFILVKVIRRYSRLRSAAFWTGVTLLSVFAVEIALVKTIGILGTRALIGPPYFLAHVLLTFSAAPALACLLLLGRHGIRGGWPLAAFICWWVGGAAIFYQYNVAETLYGIDGSGGPYQNPW